MSYRKLGLMAIVLSLVAISLYGQDVVVPIRPFDGSPDSYVNRQIVADTVASGGLLANHVYEFARDQIYLHNAIFTVPNGKTLRLRAAEGAGKKPVIYLWETGTGSTPTRPPGNFVVLNGGNLEIKNICIAGFYEYEPNRLDGVQGGLINTTAAGSSIILDGVILSNINGQHVRTGSNTVKVKITNSIFANMGALTTSNLGAGKGIDLREAACDSFILVNNTFVNYQDRAIRHYNFSNPAAGTGLIKYGRIEHNTFVNGMGFHGLFSLGNVGDQIIIADNLFMDAFALGEDSTDATRAAEWANTGEFYPNGRNRITWIFTAPNDVTQWMVKNNYYAISDSGWAFLNDFKFPVGSPLSWHINSRLGADSVNAFTQIDLTLGQIPRLMTNMMRWYESPTGANKTKGTTNFVKARDDYDRRTIEFYRDTLDCTYPTTSAAYTGGQGGFPVGDLNWFPELKTKWEQGVILPPLTPELIAPVNNAMDQPLSLTLNWKAVAQANKYHIQVATDSLFTSLILDDASLTGTSVELANLAPGTKFYWRVSASNDGGSSPWSIIWQFTTLLTLPEPVVLLSPANQSVISTDTLTFSWKASAPLINRYWFQLGIDSLMQNSLIDSTLNADQRSKLIVGLINNQKYWWRVKAGNAAGWGPFSETRSFQVKKPTGIDADKNVVWTFSLNQNYPNPFNPTTKISFTLDKAGSVNLSVFNMVGQKVATLIDDKLAAGYHEIHFDASHLANGIYLYKLESGQKVSVRKLVVLK
ncbi:MAG: T9SS type A sorting domain-containing protein [candidate division KSB1 bacterium]|nr:T9SS type A sorting domain-containing protein [candidate division KSB1 bacterium]MDZ7342331.1 T9SS type A sorting domain-containing protein [candidate division KSB1 bacterium]